MPASHPLCSVATEPPGTSEPGACRGQFGDWLVRPRDQCWAFHATGLVLADADGQGRGGPEPGRRGARGGRRGEGARARVRVRERWGFLRSRRRERERFSGGERSGTVPRMAGPRERRGMARGFASPGSLALGRMQGKFIRQPWCLGFPFPTLWYISPSSPRLYRRRLAHLATLPPPLFPAPEGCCHRSPSQGKGAGDAAGMPQELDPGWEEGGFNAAGTCRVGERNGENVVLLWFEPLRLELIRRLRAKRNS